MVQNRIHDNDANRLFRIKGNRDEYSIALKKRNCLDKSNPLCSMIVFFIC